MKIKVLIAAAALIFVIGIACSIFVLCSPSKSIVNIVRDTPLTYQKRKTAALSSNTATAATPSR